MIKERHLFKNLPIRGGSSLAIRRVASKSIRSKTFSNEYALTVLEKKSDWAQFISNKTVNQHQKDAMIMHLLKVTRVIREPIFLRNLVVLDVHAHINNINFSPYYLHSIKNIIRPITYTYTRGFTPLEKTESFNQISEIITPFLGFNPIDPNKYSTRLSIGSYVEEFLSAFALKNGLGESNLEIHGNYSNVKYNANNLTYQAEPDLVIINNRTGVQTFEDFKHRMMFNYSKSGEIVQNSLLSNYISIDSQIKYFENIIRYLRYKALKSNLSYGEVHKYFDLLDQFEEIVSELPVIGITNEKFGLKLLCLKLFYDNSLVSLGFNQDTNRLLNFAAPMPTPGQLEFILPLVDFLSTNFELIEYNNHIFDIYNKIKMNPAKMEFITNFLKYKVINGGCNVSISDILEFFRNIF